MKNDKSLDFDSTCSLLPPFYKIQERVGKRGKIYKMNNKSKIAFASSRLYGKNIYWYGVQINNLSDNDITYVCLTVGLCGILLLPIAILKKYAQYADYKMVSYNKRYYIRIKLVEDQFLLFHSKKEDINISEYFIAKSLENTSNLNKLNNSEDSYIDDLNKKSIKEILKEAESFKDYEDQYIDNKKADKRRHESKAQKERIAILENHTCQICGFYQIYKNKNGQNRWIIQVDHIIEKSRGGGETIDNLLALCPNCHTKKTYGIISITKDYKVFENGKEKELTDNHLKHTK